MVNMPDMKKKRNGCAVISLHAKIYAIGGGNNEENLSPGEVFVTATNKWSLK